MRLPVSIFLALACTAAKSADFSPPAAAREAGYLKRTFELANPSAQTIDLAATYQPGKQLYNLNYFGKQQNPQLTRVVPGAYFITSSDRYSGSLATAGCSDMSCKSFVGTAFGGGAYFEATISYDANNVIKGSANVPAVWAISLESVLHSPSLHWEGQPKNYNHTAEIDILEHNQGSLTSYGATVHDWYGIYNSTCHGFCRYSSTGNRKEIPKGDTWSSFHRVGALWVPASAQTEGYIQFYYDDRKMGQPVKWSQYHAGISKPPLSSDTKWAFGVLDQLHMVLIVGSSVDAPIKVKNISVWQQSSQYNLKQ